MRAGKWVQQKWQAWQRSADDGIQGERLAANWLAGAGYKIIARNWRSPRDRRDEIDLVCSDGDALVFVEVKTRAASALVSGYYAVDRRKKRALRRAIDDYLSAVGPSFRPLTFRFDIVEIQTYPEMQPPSVRHFANIPLFPKDYWR